MKWLNYHHLYYFWKIAQNGSIVATAHELNTTQSSISNQLKQLEGNLGFELFDRIGKKLQLSDKGRYIFKVANSIFSQGEALISEIKNNHIGINQSIIRVGAVSTLSKNIQQIFLTPLIHAKDRPHLKLYSADRISLLNQLKNFDIDFIITNSLEGMELKGYQVHKIRSFQYCFVQKKGKKKKSLKEEIQSKGLLTPLLGEELKINLDLFFQKNNLSKENIYASIEDTALLRLFAVNEEAVVLIPKIGVYRDLIDRSVEVLGNLPHSQETFYLICRSEVFDLLSLDFLITQFREIFQKGIYEN